MEKEKNLSVFYINDFKIDNIHRFNSEFKECGKYRYSFSITNKSNYLEHSTIANNLNELKKKLKKQLKILLR